MTEKKGGEDPFEWTSKQRMELRLITTMFDPLMEGNLEELDPEDFPGKLEVATVDGEGSNGSINNLIGAC